MLLAYLMHIAENKIQRLIVLGDTTSLDAELAYFDGLKKIMGGAGTNKVNVPLRFNYFYKCLRSSAIIS